MSLPEAGANYYPHQYVDAVSGQSSQPIYSNIPTIGNEAAHSAATGGGNYFFNEFGMVQQSPIIPPNNSSTSVLKELPKAPGVAVQKGNVLEIVPTTEIPASILNSSTNQTEQSIVEQKPVIASSVSWKEEVNSRHVTAAVLRLSRENEGSMRSILKRNVQQPEVVKEE